jgi:hypothetical protein
VTSGRDGGASGVGVSGVGLVVWELAEMRFCQPKQRRPGRLTAPELHPLQWQHSHAFDSGNDGGCASQLW